MSRLLLIYDPAKNYTENFEHRLRTLGIDVCRAHNSVECLHALLHRAPDFMLLAPENDSLAFERLLKMLGPRGEAARRVTVVSDRYGQRSPVVGPMGLAAGALSRTAARRSEVL